jgi:hypothetical protein
MATLAFARQIGGSLGIAAFGLVTVSTVFLVAAAALLVAVAVAPRVVDERVPA